MPVLVTVDVIIYMIILIVCDRYVQYCVRTRETVVLYILTEHNVHV